jgi:serine/threonine protein kinase
VGDFDYMASLGQGGFGRVVHARKKTTGQHLAMKIQLKTALLRHFRSDIAALESEKLGEFSLYHSPSTSPFHTSSSNTNRSLRSYPAVFASCHHPFIVSMEYSFQTDAHVFIVLDLVMGGDLHQARKACPTRRLGEDRMIFYAAELVLAISHLHEMGIIYRDLKPQNVLLRSDGHVQLTDMGLAAPLDMAWEWADDDGPGPGLGSAMQSQNTAGVRAMTEDEDHEELDNSERDPGELTPVPGSEKTSPRISPKISPSVSPNTAKRTFNPELPAISDTARETSEGHNMDNSKRAERPSAEGSKNSRSVGVVNDLEEKFQREQKIIDESQRRGSSVDMSASRAASVRRRSSTTGASELLEPMKAGEVEAPLPTPSMPGSGLTPHSEMRKKTKVRRSDVDQMQDEVDAGAAGGVPTLKSATSLRKSSTGGQRNSMSKGKSQRGVGSFRHDLTRGESLLHENLKATEDMPYIPERRKSIVGTRGYMAPEMVELRLKSYDNVSGYTEGVDWFALGVTMFELLTGRRPFDRKRGQAPPAPIHELDSLYNQLAMIENISDDDARRLRKDIEEFETIMAPIVYPIFVSDEALNFMERLMTRKLSERIGCGADGVMEIKNDPFFQGIDFDQLLELKIPPPFLPEVPDVPEKAAFPDFEEMMGSFEKDKSKPQRYNWHEVPDDDGKERFKSWDWISPLTLKREMGIAEEMAFFEVVENQNNPNGAKNSSSLEAGASRKRLSLGINKK